MTLTSVKISIYRIRTEVSEVLKPIHLFS